MEPSAFALLASAEDLLISLPPWNTKLRGAAADRVEFSLGTLQEGVRRLSASLFQQSGDSDSCGDDIGESIAVLFSVPTVLPSAVGDAALAALYHVPVEPAIHALRGLRAEFEASGAFHLLIRLVRRLLSATEYAAGLIALVTALCRQYGVGYAAIADLLQDLPVESFERVAQYFLRPSRAGMAWFASRPVPLADAELLIAILPHCPPSAVGTLVPLAVSLTVAEKNGERLLALSTSLFALYHRLQGDEVVITALITLAAVPLAVPPSLDCGSTEAHVRVLLRLLGLPGAIEAVCRLTEQSPFGTPILHRAVSNTLIGLATNADFRNSVPHDVAGRLVSALSRGATLTPSERAEAFAAMTAFHQKPRIEALDAICALQGGTSRVAVLSSPAVSPWAVFELITREEHSDLANELARHALRSVPRPTRWSLSALAHYLHSVLVANARLSAAHGEGPCVDSWVESISRVVMEDGEVVAVVEDALRGQIAEPESEPLDSSEVALETDMAVLETLNGGKDSAVHSDCSAAQMMFSSPRMMRDKESVDPQEVEDGIFCFIYALLMLHTDASQDSLSIHLSLQDFTNIVTGQDPWSYLDSATVDRIYSTIVGSPTLSMRAPVTVVPRDLFVGSEYDAVVRLMESYSLRQRILDASVPTQPSTRLVPPLLGLDLGTTVKRVVAPFTGVSSRVALQTAASVTLELLSASTALLQEHPGSVDNVRAGFKAAQVILEAVEDVVTTPRALPLLLSAPRFGVGLKFLSSVLPLTFADDVLASTWVTRAVGVLKEVDVVAPLACDALRRGRRLIPASVVRSSAHTASSGLLGLATSLIASASTKLAIDEEESLLDHLVRLLVPVSAIVESLADAQGEALRVLCNAVEPDPSMLVTWARIMADIAITGGIESSRASSVLYAPYLFKLQSVCRLHRCFAPPALLSALSLRASTVSSEAFCEFWANGDLHELVPVLKCLPAVGADATVWNGICSVLERAISEALAVREDVDELLCVVYRLLGGNDKSMRGELADEDVFPPLGILPAEGAEGMLRLLLALATSGDATERSHTPPDPVAALFSAPVARFASAAAAQRIFRLCSSILASDGPEAASVSISNFSIQIRLLPPLLLLARCSTSADTCSTDAARALVDSSVHSSIAPIIRQMTPVLVSYASVPAAVVLGEGVVGSNAGNVAGTKAALILIAERLGRRGKVPAPLKELIERLS